MVIPDLLKKLEALSGHYYQLWDYQKSHSVLTIRAGHLDQPAHNIHLVFTSVYYIQMPINWREGDLGLASETEFAEMVKAMKMRGSPETLRETLSLYKAQPPNGRVYILGNLSAIEHDVEPIYKGNWTLAKKG